MENKKCVVKDCENSGRVRGLCSGCYTSASYLMKIKKLTWKDLEEKGLANPPSDRTKKLGKLLSQFYGVQE